VPSSSHFHISKMVDWITQIQPKSVLDVGVGFGKWGFLAREYLDVSAGRYAPADWQVRIEGVEAFPEYATPLYSYIYDQVHYGDVREVIGSLPDYDLVIIGDVIEHFTKKEGRELLNKLRTKARFVLLSSPTVFFQQEMFGNEYETHRSFWTVRDFAEWEFDYDEYNQWVFVALLRGDLAGSADLHPNGWPAQIVYSRRFLKAHPKLAQIAKSALCRLPTGR
jgi:SAM-dependent methyltransferase